jgi:hypothetical protein
MWIRWVSAAMNDPSEIDELRELWRVNGARAEPVSAGRLMGHHLRSIDAPEQIRALSTWRTREDAERFAASEISIANLRAARRFYTDDPHAELYYVAD